MRNLHRTSPRLKTTRSHDYRRSPFAIRMRILLVDRTDMTDKTCPKISSVRPPFMVQHSRTRWVRTEVAAIAH